MNSGLPFWICMSERHRDTQKLQLDRITTAQPERKWSSYSTDNVLSKNIKICFSGIIKIILSYQKKKKKFFLTSSNKEKLCWKSYNT